MRPSHSSNSNSRQRAYSRWLSNRVPSASTTGLAWYFVLTSASDEPLWQQPIRQISLPRLHASLLGDRGQPATLTGVISIQRPSPPEFLPTTGTGPDRIA